MLDIKKLTSDTILEIEHLDKQAIMESGEPHRHEYYEIFWALEGEGRHSIDFIDYPLQAGLIYFIAPGQVHHCHSLPDRLLAISFNADLISSDSRSQQILKTIFLVNRSRHPSVSIDETGREVMSKLIDVLEDELAKSDADKEFINIIFTGFLRHLVRYQPREELAPKANDERMLKLLTLIDENYKAQKQTEFYADALAISKKRLNEFSIRYFGKTVARMLREKVMIEARRELVYTSQTVKTIALELGFEDVAYFTRYFKRDGGITPQAFRNNWLSTNGNGFS